MPPTNKRSGPFGISAAVGPTSQVKFGTARLLTQGKLEPNRTVRLAAQYLLLSPLPKRRVVFGRLRPTLDSRAGKQGLGEGWFRRARPFP